MKSMSVKDFRKLGLLQEVNRQLLHPMGLALEVEINEEDGTERFGEVWDCRDDPEGIHFKEGTINQQKAKSVGKLFWSKRENRESKLGYHVQPYRS